jgi:hypothetical protein
MVIGATETGVQSRTLAYRTAPDPGGLRALGRDWKLAKVWLLRELKGQGR